MLHLGLDLSHWNADIDVSCLQQDGVKFLYLKATEASSWVDKTSLQRAIDTDVPYVGFYHLFRDVDWERQFEHFRTYIQRVPFNLPPAIDVETRHIRGSGDLDKFRQGVYSFAEALKHCFGTAVIYISRRGVREFGTFDFDSFTGIWWADHTDEAREQGYPRGEKHTKDQFWQWTSEYEIQGWKVDANYYIGTQPIAKLGFRYEPVRDWFVQPKQTRKMDAEDD